MFVLTTRGKMDDGFGIRRGLEDRTLLHQVAPEGSRIREIAVMGERQATAREIGEHGLDIAPDRAAGGGIAHMPDRVRAAQIRGVAMLAENVPDQSDMAFGDELRAIECDDTGCFLPA